ncbi:hypothetical protein MNBD_ALPHA11-1234 [hydrothermal vent metagenome]|uniref:DUF3311 domain-containing protein n=1 Tax=hydrothermal vent metagenome TaxID=652676 RepID=A0A3B0TKP6_9ZZZZ
MTGPKKIAFLAKLLPVIGIILILPPLVSIANVKANLFGFPAIITYIFAVWIFLILTAYLLQRKLPSSPAEQNEQFPNNNSRNKLNDTNHD